MRPLKLMMQAFGPYASREEIDFTRLGSRTMFVISGKTGSGKTTIFDGISYAIYGKASGEDRNGSDLRSHFANQELPTEVSLEFSLRNKTYFIQRSPQQEKKKDRGEGYTTISAKAELYMYDEEGVIQLLAANVRDVDIKIKEIMLIDSNQFRQILMIPQGEFRKLLTSDSKDKEIILQRLFHTELYKRVEDRLKEEATELRTAVELQINDRNQAIRSIQALFHEELIKVLNEESTNETLILPLLQTELHLMAEELQKLKDHTLVKEAERDRLQKQIIEAEAIIKQLKTRDELKDKKEELEQQRPLMEAQEKSIVLAQKAAVLTQQEELCHRLKKEVDEQRKKRDLIISEIDSLTITYTESEIALKNEKERERERTLSLEKVNHLKQIEEDVRSISIFRNEVDRLQKKLHAKSLDKTKLDERIQAVEKELKVQQEERQQIEKEKAQYYENERLMDKLEREYDLFIKYEQQQSSYQTAADDANKKSAYFQHTLARLQDAKVLVEGLEQKWLHGQAIILAEKLQSGEECPVCGSTHHPNPAVHDDGNMPNEADIKAAKLQAAEIETQKSAAESALYKAQSFTKSLADGLEELLKSIVEQRGEIEENEIGMVRNRVWEEKQHLYKKQELFRKKLSQLDVLIHHQERLEKERDLRSEQRDPLTKELNELTIHFTEKNTLLSRLIEKIPERLQTLSAFESELNKAVEHHKELLERYEKIQQHYQQTKEKLAIVKTRYEETEKQITFTMNKLVAEKEAFVVKMTEQGFTSFALYDGAKKTEQEILQFQQLVRSYREEYRSVTDRFKELAKLLEGIQHPDVSGLNAAFEQVKKEHQELQDRYADLSLKKKEIKKLAEKIVMINNEIKSIEEKYKLIGHLYEITKGQNTYRITFERYVLAAFLDDILQEANQRLAKMTSGRYELHRKTDRSKGNIQSGLELLVFDQYTGQERHVKTLSGGESFIAALSLALGLADIVQQYAGGVSLETMFIDEGFGTLDPESLDQAIEALIDIQSSGRLVGIISHVPELKERIDARLEVIATQSGSKAEFQFLNG